MTQKELAYIEDAIGHEGNIIKIITECLNKIDDQKVISFLNNELTKHQTLKNNLTLKLEEKVNE